MLSAFFISLENSENLENMNNEVFRLPIDYLPETDRHSLSDTVASDLELVSSDLSKNTMYHYLLNPQTPFEENMVPLWSKSYTTNTGFLKDTQEVIQKVGTNIPITSPDYENMITIWKDVKEDPEFLERYSYMELEMFRWVNKTPSFLQSISIVNMGSPVLSFLIPFILFLMPFLIVRIQGHPITFSMYFSVLKDISKNHFIGKMISSAENFSLSNVIYLFVLIGLYLYQIYQNYMMCVRFYANISRINEQICTMQKYIAYTVSKMDAFKGVIKDKSSYVSFGQDLAIHRQNLFQLGEHISGVRPFTPSLGKITEIGGLLGCYYEMYSNEEYGRAFKYSFYFHGYLQNIRGFYENLSAGRLGFSEFSAEKKIDDMSQKDMDDSSKGLVIKEQFYPALINQSFVTNSADLSLNMVVTGPNAAGKTTYLKTTILNVIFTQQFGGGFYSQCMMTPYTHIHSYLNIPDTSGRDSLFQAESRRCKEIIDAVISSGPNERHFCIFDELYSGTNPAEASKSAYAFLIWLSQRNNVDYILTTHYVDICSRWRASDRIANWQMCCNVLSDGEIEYTYKIEPGVSHVQGAIKVLRDMEYPPAILETISKYDIVEFFDVAEEPRELIPEQIEVVPKKRGPKKNKSKLS